MNDFTIGAVFFSYSSNLLLNIDFVRDYIKSSANDNNSSSLCEVVNISSCLFAFRRELNHVV